MSKEIVLQEVVKVIKGISPECCLDFSKINENTKLVDDLGFDSITYLMLATSLEENFDLILRKDDVIKLASVGNIVDLILAKIDQ